MIWPSAITSEHGGFIVFENIASLMHFLFALLIALVAGCERPMLAGYTVYQLVSTLLKTLAFPRAHPWSDWGWDFFGDMTEYLAGYGLAYGLGIAGLVRPRGRFERACSPGAVALFWGALIGVWLILFARLALSGGP